MCNRSTERRVESFGMCTSVCTPSLFWLTCCVDIQLKAPQGGDHSRHSFFRPLAKGSLDLGVLAVLGVQGCWHGCPFGFDVFCCVPAFLWSLVHNCVNCRVTASKTIISYTFLHAVFSSVFCVFRPIMLRFRGAKKRLQKASPDLEIIGFPLGKPCMYFY